MKVDISTDFQKILRMNELDLLAEHFIYSENYLSACPSTSQKQLLMSFQPSMAPEKDSNSSGVTAQSPCILGGCEHIFCHVCVERYLGTSCPHCHIPAHVKDADVNRQLFNIASLCQKLRNVLTSHGEENLDTEPNVEVYSETAECTPQQPVKDVYHFDTPTPQKSGKQNIAHGSDATQIPDRNSKTKRDVNKKRKTVPAEKCKKEINRRNNRLNDIENDRKRASISNRDRKKIPFDQSTMTQFYDYDDEDNDIGLVKEKEDSLHKDDLQPVKIAEKDGIVMTLQESRTIEDKTTVTEDKTVSTKKKRQAVQRKKKKAATIITEICKATTRLRSSDNGQEKEINGKETERTNWFNEDNSAVLNVSEAEKLTSEKDCHELGNTSYQEESVIKSPRVEQKESENKRNSTKLQSKKDKVIPRRTRSEQSNSPVIVNAKKQKQATVTTKPKAENFDMESTRTSDIADDQKLSLSTPKSVPKVKSRLSSGRKLTPGSPRNKVVQQRSKSTPTPVSNPRSALSPGNRSTPQRSRTSCTSAALSPAFNKRNAKGETPLQVAAIKNDVSKVAELLGAGASPNVRDNAGWTPLHEACNHGYTEVAKLLLDNGAMINVPGADNDTPLHDAVSNGRIDCVKLLVSRGASLTVRNLKGLTPEDFAVSGQMKDALRTSVKGNVTADTQLPLDTLEYQQPCLLGTSLSRDQKIVLQKCASLLSAKLCEDCTPEVTHVITSCNTEGRCARTIKYLQAVLTGKWIVSMDWVNTCLELGSKVCEEGFEVQGSSTNPNSQAPFKGRMNRKHQLPSLFDGCQFYFHGNFEFSMPTKDDLVEVVKSGGGRILSREPKPGHLDSLDLTVPYHADTAGNLSNCCIFVVHEKSPEFQPVRTKHMCSVPISWIMDSAAEFKLKEIPMV